MLKNVIKNVGSANDCILIVNSPEYCDLEITSAMAKNICICSETFWQNLKQWSQLGYILFTVYS